MTTKRWLAMFIGAALCVALAACAKSSETPVRDKQGGAAVTGEISGEITVSCYDTMLYKSFLEEAAKAFEAKYVGTKVNIETFSAMPEIKTMEQDGMKMAMIQQGDDTQNRNDYINKINTELMGGQGADVLAMDILPAYRYADNGQLEDMAKYMDADADFRMGDYRENILRAMRYKGGQYVLPLDYSFDYFAYDSSLLDSEAQSRLADEKAFTYEQLVEIAQKSFADNQSSASVPAKMFGLTGDVQKGADMFNELLAENYRNFVDIEQKTADFDDGRFAALLELVKEYNQKGYLMPSRADAQMTTDINEMLEKNKDERYFFKTKNYMNLLQYFNKDSQMMVSFSTGASSGNEEDDEIAGLEKDSNGNIPFTSSQCYAINANSTNKTTAWAFIKFLLSDEMQSSPQLSPIGLPVNNQARMQKAKMMISGNMRFNATEEGGSTPQDIVLDEKQQAVFDEYTKAIEAYSDVLNSYIIEDTTINSIIQTEVKSFFDGTKSAEEVTGVLQNKISMYLSE